MQGKGFVNVAAFITDYLIDVVWALVRTVLSPIFLIAHFIDDDGPISEVEWWSI